MKLGSLFSGTGMFELAGALCGVEPVWNSEIEPTAVLVTDARLPQCKQLGSVIDVHGDEIEPVDILTFGSPCQGLSVAGERKGIHDDNRSNLFFEAIRIVKEMRNATSDRYPRTLVWENVPGALTCNGGDDFQAALQALAEIADPDASIPRPQKWGQHGCIVGRGYSIAWNVIDAQDYGVPQRRKRIYLICRLGSERAGEILFKSPSMHGHYPPKQNQKETATRYLDASPEWRCEKGGVNDGIIYDARGNGNGKVSCTITGDHQNRITDYTAVLVEKRVVFPDVVGTICANSHPGSYCGQDAYNNMLLVEEDNVEYRVRRLTPEESARLQGMPEGWFDGLGLSDSAKFRMIGNAVALPCALDIIARIVDEEMG